MRLEPAKITWFMHEGCLGVRERLAIKEWLVSWSQGERGKADISWTTFTSCSMNAVFSRHTAFIIEWLENEAVHFVVRGIGKSIGGSKVKTGVINRALEHMKAWVQLARACMQAEQSFAEINAFLNEARLTADT